MTTDSIDLLSAQLLALPPRDWPLSCGCVHALGPQMGNACHWDGGLIVIPLRGTGCISDGLGTVETSPGNVLVVPDGRSIDWKQPSAMSRDEFFAIGVVLDESAVEVARQLLGYTDVAPPGKLGMEALPRVADPLWRWVCLMREGNRALALHAIVEVIIRLHDLGHVGILRPRAPGLAQSIRKLVIERPSHSWQSTDFEQRFLLSGPTLRRRLSQEGTTLRKIVAEARMSEGMHLLLTTSMPVKAIAARVGYESPSSFSRRFFESYGVEPAEMARR